MNHLRLLIVSGHLLFATSALLRADLATLTIDVIKGTVDPENPAVNTAYGDAVALRFLANGQPIARPAEVRVDLSLNLLTGDRLTQRTGAEGYKVRDFLIFHKCGRRDLRDLSTRRGLPTGKERCPFYVEAGPTTEIYMDNGYVLISVWYFQPPDLTTPSTRTPIPLLVVYRPSFLIWSAGFSFLFDDLRDEQFRLTANGEGDTQLLSSAGHGEVPYQLAAFAHYRFRQSRFSAAFGLGTDVPVENLSAMLGLSYSVQTLPFVNSGHITLGVAYAPRRRLRPEFRGLTVVPSGLTPDSITREQYDFGPFLGISFSFLGGEEQFKAVYSRKPS